MNDFVTSLSLFFSMLQTDGPCSRWFQWHIMVTSTDGSHTQKCFLTTSLYFGSRRLFSAQAPTGSWIHMLHLVSWILYGQRFNLKADMQSHWPSTVLHRESGCMQCAAPTTWLLLRRRMSFCQMQNWRYTTIPDVNIFLTAVLRRNGLTFLRSGGRSMQPVLRMFHPGQRLPLLKCKA